MIKLWNGKEKCKTDRDVSHEDDIDIKKHVDENKIDIWNTIAFNGLQSVGLLQYNMNNSY